MKKKKKKRAKQDQKTLLPHYQHKAKTRKIRKITNKKIERRKRFTIAKVTTEPA